MNDHDPDYPAVLAVDHPCPIAGPALMVRTRGNNPFLERVEDPGWDDLLRVASRAMFHCEDHHHRFVEGVERVQGPPATFAMQTAAKRGIRSVNSVWRFSLGS